MPGARRTRQPSPAAGNFLRCCSLNKHDPRKVGTGFRNRIMLHASTSRDGRSAAMPMNAIYHGPSDLPGVIPVFPLPGALAAAARADAAQHFRAALSGNGRRRAHLAPSPDRHDPARQRASRAPRTSPICSRSAASDASPRFAESGDGRYLLQLTGVSRFRVEEELKVATPYRQCRVTYAPFADDFVARKGEDQVDRKQLLRTLSEFPAGQ